MGSGVGGPCVSPSPFGLDFGTLDFGLCFGLTIHFCQGRGVCYHTRQGGPFCPGRQIGSVTRFSETPDTLSG